MRLFGGDRIQNMMEKFDLDEDTPIENRFLTKSIENAQTTVESRNFQARKSVLEYDDVMNKQREIIYGQRKQVLDGLDIKATVMNMMRSSIANHVALAFGENAHLNAAGYREMLRAWRAPTSSRRRAGAGGGDPLQDPGGVHGPLRGGRGEDLRGQGAGDHAAHHAGAGAGPSCSGWWTSTGWSTSTPWTT